MSAHPGKQAAGEWAAAQVQPSMKVGLGTGSTAYYLIRKLGERVQAGLKIEAVATSVQTEVLAREAGIPLIELTADLRLDLVIDGADEIDPAGNLTKGGGGALFREKIIALLAHTYLIIADDSKAVPVLGQFPLPVEIVPFGWELTARWVAETGCTPVRRMAGTAPYHTDNGNYILDCAYGTIPDPVALHTRLIGITGVVETGLFTGMQPRVVLGYADGHITVDGIPA
ncbi:MAG: ribose-5-phosphate isomerase RpiA [Bacteroidia bacterium]|nr:ribose-5-phosphate isomerase RpiA [Bacteroidia bacterium]